MTTPSENKRPPVVQGDLHNLPEALEPLKALPHWVCWKWEWRVDKKGKGAWTKPLYQPRNPGTYARSNAPKTWGTYAEALAAFTAGRCDGIGFVLKGSGFAAFDLDKVRDLATGSIAAEAMAIIARAKSYSEITVSGTGLRVIGTATGAKVHCKQKLNGAMAVETFRDCERYITVAGNPLPDTNSALVNIDVVIDQVVAELAEGAQQPKDKKKKTTNSKTTPRLELPDDLVKLIDEEPEPDVDLSERFHGVVCRMGDLHWTAEEIEQRIDGKPVVPERYNERLNGEIERCLGKRKDTALKEEIERLAQLSTVNFERERKAAAKKLGLRIEVLEGLVEAVHRKRDAEANDEIVAKINRNYALVLAGGNATVMKFEDKTKFRLLQIDAFKQWFSNRFVTLGKITIPVGVYWLSHADRRQYHGIEFEPKDGRKGYDNLWQGFAVEPKHEPEKCAKFLAHVKNNAACGNEDTYKWIIGWWAQIFQQPTVKMETALVLRGKRGTGKTKIGDVIGTLLSVHYLKVVSARYITGQFNSHMASLLLLHADEAFWAGDKASVGTINDLVTGYQHMLEYKRIDPISVKNFIRLFVTGNPDWLVPAGFKERRWAIFDMGEGSIQDNDYFDAIDEEMKNGGYEALLDYLLNFDLDQVNLRKIPATVALLDQQVESMTPEQSWWFELLVAGELPFAPEGAKEPWTCDRHSLHRSYIEYAQRQGARFRSSSTQLGMFLNKQLKGKLRNFRPSKGRRCYVLPPLKECRDAFAKNLGHSPDWNSDDWEKDEWEQPVHDHKWWREGALS